MLQSALEHYRRQQRITGAALASARRKGLHDPLGVARVVALFQVYAAQEAIDSIEPMLQEQDIDAEPVGMIPTESFAGTASDGRPLDSLFGQAATPGALDLMVVTQLQDAARAAAATSITARPNIGYVRMLNPPSCSRCAVLAGKFFKYNQGFLRHPRCDCRHIPSLESVAGDLITDPRAYFDSLSPNEQDRTFTNAGAEAIRRGADIGQVVNVRRRTAGMNFAGIPTFKRDARGNLFTTEGTTRRGRAAQQQAGLRRNGPQQLRVMPETILARAATREEAQRLLRLYGYITDSPTTARGREVFAEMRRAERNARAVERRAEQQSLRG